MLDEVTDLHESLFQAFLTETLLYFLGPVLLATSLFLLWRCFRRAGYERNSAFATLARGFGLLFLSIALPFAMMLVALLAFEDSTDHISGLWFDLPAALLAVSGTVQIAFGTKRLRQQTDLGN